MRRSNKRGSVLVGVLIAMVILALVVMSITANGSLVSESSSVDLDGMRALYATEAGMNMAIREIYENADEDGDGTIGSISNDGNSANDPNIGGAQVVVTKTVGASTIIRATGRSGVAQKSMEATLQ